MIYDVAIIGAGPAGLTAGIFTCNAGLNSICFEKLGCGGQVALTYEIINYPAFDNISGFDLADKIKNHAEHAGLKIEYTSVEKIKKLKSGFSIKTTNGIFKAKKVIIATGSKARSLGLKNEKDFLSKGVSYCASCDGAFYKNKTVAVVGSGDSAVEYVNYLSNIAKKVYLIYRGNNFRAGEFKLNKIKKLKNVEIIKQTVVLSLIGKDVLTGVEIETNKNKQVLAVDGLFVAVGHMPDLNFLDFEISLDSSGFIVVDENQKTSVNNLFACGDITSKKFKQIITACADGARAGNSCARGGI